MIADDPVLRSRAADAAEKVSRRRPELLAAHKRRLLGHVAEVPQQGVRWHVGYSHLTVVACLVNGFTPRVGRRW
jgi:hypothetical protein